MVSLSNHDSGNGGILRRAQDERKLKKSITLHRPWSKRAGWFVSDPWTGHAALIWRLPPTPGRSRRSVIA